MPRYGKITCETTNIAIGDYISGECKIIKAAPAPLSDSLLITAKDDSSIKDIRGVGVSYSIRYKFILSSTDEREIATGTTYQVYGRVTEFEIKDAEKGYFPTLTLWLTNTSIKEKTGKSPYNDESKTPSQVNFEVILNPGPNGGCCLKGHVDALPYKV